MDEENPPTDSQDDPARPTPNDNYGGSRVQRAIEFDEPPSQGSRPLVQAGPSNECPPQSHHTEAIATSSTLPPIPNPSLTASVVNRDDDTLAQMKGFLAGSIFGRNEPGAGEEQASASHSGAQPAEADPQRSRGQSENDTGESSSGRSKGRPPGYIHNFKEPMPGKPGSFRCKYCKTYLGSMNATRFSKHSIEECQKIATPVKLELARKTRSKAIGMPRSRSDAAIALERANNPDKQKREVSLVANTTEDVASVRSNATSRGSGRRGRGRKRGRGNCDAAVFSDSSLSKRQKEESELSSELKPPECTTTYINNVVTGAVEYIISSASPFSIFDKRHGQDSNLLRLLRIVHPNLAGKYLPGSHLLGGKYLDEYYARMRKMVREDIRSALESGFGTIIFDGWDNVKSASVVNMLLKMEPAVHIGSQVFFLKSIYTGSKTVGAKEYVKMVEEIMDEYGGMGRICAITSDNTSSCLNARRDITNKYKRIVGVNDQSHVADLLIEDICRIPWISEVIVTVGGIARELHNHRKLKDRFERLMEVFNTALKSHDIFRNRTPPSAFDRGPGARKVGEFNSDRDPKGVFDGFDKNSVRTAVMLAQMSNTRFASAEGVVDCFLRSIYVLRTLVSEQDFYTELYKPKNRRHRLKIEDIFIKPIESAEFEVRTREIHKLLLLLRRYLRIFDSNDARISEVYPFTVELGRRLESLPVTSVLTEERKSEVLEVFRRRRDGPIGAQIRVRLLDDIHYTAFLLDPNRAPPDPQPFIPHFQRHAERYAATQNIASVTSWVQGLLFAFSCQLAEWLAQRKSEEGRRTMKLWAGNPLIWWSFTAHKNQDLATFARRTLSASPSSCAVERSFSVQKRLHTKERSRLGCEKVQKLMFCHWNLTLMRKLDTFDKFSFWESIQRTVNIVTDVDNDVPQGSVVDRNEGGNDKDNGPSAEDSSSDDGSADDIGEDQD